MNWTGILTTGFTRVALLFLLFAGSAAEAAISYTLEGCRSTSIPDGYDLEANDFVCPDSAYVTGNLKTWAELDLVPHRVTIQNKGSEPENFVFTVGGDYLYAEGGELRGWDYISELVLDVEHSNQICIDWATAHQDDLVVQDLLVTPDDGGVGGVFTTIYRRIAVGDPDHPEDGLSPGAYCVANYVQRLALGSSGYSGSSLQSNLWNEFLESGGIGEKRVQLPNVLAQTVDKSMIAVQDGNYAWTLEKSAAPSVVNLGDTCDPETPKSKEVEVSITWERTGPNASGNVQVKTIIDASNTSSRSIDVHVTDNIYNGEDLINTYECDITTLPAGTIGQVCEHEIEVSEENADNLHDIAMITYSDPVYPDPQWPILGSRDAEASAILGPSGVNLDENATITDHEWITSTYGTLSFAAISASNGTFDNGYTGEVTQGDVNWTSALQTGSGSVTFVKAVSWENPTIDSATLSDTAMLNGSDGFMAQDSAAISIVADALVEVGISKTIPNILQNEEAVDFNFTVTGPNDYEQNVSIGFAAGEFMKTLTIGGLEPGIYTVSEHASEGFVPVGPAQHELNITLPTCDDTANFVNNVPKSQAYVVKHTLPADNAEGWEMRLYKNGDLLETVYTDSDGNGEFTSLLGEGNYSIIEIMKNNWYTSAEPVGCEFIIDFPADGGKTYTCTIENSMFGEIIIHKKTIPAGEETIFSFAQDMNASYMLSLSDGQNYTFDKLVAGNYKAGEDDPTPDFDLTDIECNETINSDSTVNLGDRNASILLSPGETVECTFTNTKRGMVDVLKRTNGSEVYADVWNFTLTGNGVNLSDSTSGGALVDFGGVKLVPGDYTLCESAVPVAWINIWTLDGTPVDYYDPNPNPEATNEDRCYDFTILPGQQRHFVIDNNYTPPGGETRTIGYWKNWSSCSNGNQAEKAAERGGWMEGYWLIDDVLPLTIGELVLDNCEDAVAILDKRDIHRGKKRANDAAYGMSAQLVAAMANYAAGAEQCTAATNAIDGANALLIDIDFDGKGSYLTPKDAKKPGKAALRSEANSLAGTLDDYNNGGLCP